MTGDREALLRALDFNGTNSSDTVAATYFRQAAVLIRELERERSHYQQVASVERLKWHDAQHVVRSLTKDLENTRAALSTTEASAAPFDVGDNAQTGERS